MNVNYNRIFKKYAKSVRGDTEFCAYQILISAVKKNKAFNHSKRCVKAVKTQVFNIEKCGCQILIGVGHILICVKSFLISVAPNFVIYTPKIGHI